MVGVNLAVHCFSKTIIIHVNIVLFHSNIILAADVGVVFLSQKLWWLTLP